MAQVFTHEQQSAASKNFDQYVAGLKRARQSGVRLIGRGYDRTPDKHRVYIISSSRDQNHGYQVTVFPGHISCQCVGYRQHSHCMHQALGRFLACVELDDRKRAAEAAPGLECESDSSAEHDPETVDDGGVAQVLHTDSRPEWEPQGIDFSLEADRRNRANGWKPGTPTGATAPRRQQSFRILK